MPLPYVYWALPHVWLRVHNRELLRTLGKVVIPLVVTCGSITIKLFDRPVSHKLKSLWNLNAVITASNDSRDGMTQNLKVSMYYPKSITIQRYIAIVKWCKI